MPRAGAGWGGEFPREYPDGGVLRTKNTLKPLEEETKVKLKGEITGKGNVRGRKERVSEETSEECSCTAWLRGARRNLCVKQ